MDYKKWFPDKTHRMKLLKKLDFVPDGMMVFLQYRILTGRWLHIWKPTRYSEKLQWYKLHYRDPLMTQCADKLAVRDYIQAKGYGDTLIPLIKAYQTPQEIQLGELPDQFVLKTNNGSKTNIVVIDKKLVDLRQMQTTLTEFMDRWSGKRGREWAYYHIPPRIICETYLRNDEMTPLLDYKFYCFNGKPYYLYVVQHAQGNRTVGYYGLFDMNFRRLPYAVPSSSCENRTIEKPEQWETMKQMVRDLAVDFPHVRVDLYYHQKHIYFGELTFYARSGYESLFDSDEIDVLLGDLFLLPPKKRG